MPVRAMPQVGATVTVSFLSTTVGGVVERVSDSGRRLEVLTDEGEHLSFALNPATARFTAEGALTGARLRFEAGSA